MPSTWTSLNDAWSGWVQVAEQLTDDDWERPTRLPGWKVIDLFAHAAAWPRMFGHLVEADEVGTEPEWRTAAHLLRYFNTPGGMAEASASAVAERARQEASAQTPDHLVDQFRAGLEACERASQLGIRVVAYPGAGSVYLHEAAKIGLLEAVVHRLDFDQALDRKPDLPAHCLSTVAGILAAVPGLVTFIEAATGRSDAPVLPVVR